MMIDEEGSFQGACRETAPVYRFELVRSREPFSGRISYGILETQLVDGVAEETAYIPAISCDEAAVEQLMHRCARGQLSPVHLLDVVMDAIP